MQKLIKTIIKIIIICFVLGAVATFWTNVVVYKYNKNIEEDSIPSEKRQTALVLGAYTYKNGDLSHMFKDRVETAIALYNKGKVEKILVSGDHGRVDYDEVNAAKKYLLDNGIPAKDIFLDHAGFDTYDSIYRAKEIFDVESAYIVTQEFHLPRALFIANSTGLNAKGVRADRREYAGIKYNYIREIPANCKAALNVIFKSNPKFLGEKIPITGDSKKSWD